jgi:hypothetical protein
MQDDDIVRPVQHGSLVFDVPEQHAMLRTLQALEQVDLDLKDEIRAARQAEILEKGKAEVRAIFEKRAAETVRALEQQKAQILAQARSVTEDDARVAARVAAFAPAVAQSRTPDALAELWDDARLTENPTAIRLMADAILARIDEAERTVAREDDLLRTKGIARRNPDLHVKQRDFAALKARIDREFGEWRRANPPRAQQVAQLDRQIESAAAQVQLKFDSFMVLFGPKTDGAMRVPLHQVRRFGSMEIGPGFDRVMARRMSRPVQ